MPRKYRTYDALSARNQRVYKLNATCVQVTREQELGLVKNRKKFDIREEYFVRGYVLVDCHYPYTRYVQRLSLAQDDNWENKRIPRLPGEPEWGVASPEPPPRSES